MKLPNSSSEETIFSAALQLKCRAERSVYLDQPPERDTTSHPRMEGFLDGSIIPPAPIPGPEIVDFRKGWKVGDEAMPADWKQWVHASEPPGHGALAEGRQRQAGLEFVPGSNAWAVEGSLSSSGAALVASDMHLGYSMPGPFYRVRLKWNEGGHDHDVVGEMLPGAPGVAAGSNGQVAWAPTAAHLDLVDEIVLETDPHQPDRYRVPGGWAECERVTERIEVRGSKPVELTTRWTLWGPVIERTSSGTPVAFDGRPVVVRHLFHSPEALDLRLSDLMIATDTGIALRIAAESGSPVINVLVGDRAGRVGWTIAGQLPRRLGSVGSKIRSWADPAVGWNGWLRPEEHPRIASPEVSRVFSGNHRKLGSAAYRALCPADSVLGARAGQIREALSGLTNASPADMLATQLDDRALLLARWRKLLLSTLQHPRASAVLTNDLAEVVRHTANWNGRATPDSVGYRLVRGVSVERERVFVRAVECSRGRFARRAQRSLDARSRTSGLDLDRGPAAAPAESPVHRLRPFAADCDG